MDGALFEPQYSLELHFSELSVSFQSFDRFDTQTMIFFPDMCLTGQLSSHSSGASDLFDDL